MIFYYNRRTFPHLGLAAFLSLTNDSLKNISPHVIQIGKNVVPLDEQNNFRLWWYGNGGVDACFKYYSIHAIILSAMQEKRGQIPKIPSSAFKNKIVFIGSNAPGLLDFRVTPFTSIEKYPGVEIHATMVSNLLQGDILHKEKNAVMFLILITLCLSVAFSMIYFSSVVHTILITVFFACGWIATAFIFFVQSKMWLHIVVPEAGIILTFALSAAYSFATEGKARKQLRTVFSRYLDKSVVAKIESHPEEVELKGSLMKATVFFSDIKDFTATTETMPPIDVMTHLNNYFSLTGEILVNKYKAFLDKYIGDATMAIFSIPIQQPDDAPRACRAALEIQSALARERELHPETPFEITRIGLHTGTLVVGSIGSRHRLEYTAIGDTVNVASRLESVNKLYRTKILLSEETYDIVKDEMFCREIDIVHLKGKGIPTRIYELLSLKKNVPDDLVIFVNDFTKAKEYYFKKDFKQSCEKFSALLQKYPDDGPTNVFFVRCSHYVTTPPPENWDGIFDLTTK